METPSRLIINGMVLTGREMLRLKSYPFQKITRKLVGLSTTERLVSDKKLCCGVNIILVCFCLIDGVNGNMI